MQYVPPCSPPVNEIKFLVNASNVQAIRDWVKQEFAPDPVAQLDADECYCTTSLYFDTPYFDVLRQRGSHGRAKYRVRKYGEAGPLFLERKLKRNDVVRKWRTVVPVDELPMLSKSSTPPWPGRWFGQRLSLRALRPVCQISYRRLARVGTSESGDPLRLTLDDQVRAVRVDRLEFHDPRAADRLDGLPAILELKYRRARPEVFTRLIEEFRLTPRPVSKYRTAAVALGYGARLVHA